MVSRHTDVAVFPAVSGTQLQPADDDFAAVKLVANFTTAAGRVGHCADEVVVIIDEVD